MDETKIKLNELIDSAQLNSDLKGVLRKSLDAIYEHEKKILSEIKSEVEKDIKSARNKKDFVIAVALVPREKISSMNEKNFHVIKEDGKSEQSFSIYFQPSLDLDDKVLQAGPYFLRCSYDEVDEICKKKYSGHSAKGIFEYELSTQTRFISQEKKLFRIAELYKIETPVIFSPYARRTVDIKILNENNFDKATADFEFEKNFGGKFIENHVLMWNVEVLEKKSSTSYIAPTDDDIFHRYIYQSGIDKDTFVLPTVEPRINVEVQKFTDNQISVVTSSELVDDKGELLKIFPVKSEENFPVKEIFYNSLNTGGIFDKKRLRTAGDINYILKIFSNDEFFCEFVGVSEKTGEILNYQKSRGHNYYLSQGEKFIRARAKMPKCLIKFSAPNIYATDYANFVLHFLTRTYPEYLWTGVF